LHLQDEREHFQNAGWTLWLSKRLPNREHTTRAGSPDTTGKAWLPLSKYVYTEYAQMTSGRMVRNRAEQV